MNAQSVTPRQTLHQPPQPIVRDFLAALFRGKWVFIGVFSGVVLSSLLVVQLMNDVYESTASVLVNTRYSETPTPLFLDPLRSSQNLNILQNELEKLESRSLADTVVGLLVTRAYLDAARHSPILLIQPSGSSESTESPAPRPEIVKRLRRSVTFELVRESDVIRITAKSPDPREATLVANIYAQAYCDQSMHLSRSKSRSIRQYLDAQVKEKHHALVSIEDSLERYMEKKGVVSLDDETKKVVDQLSHLKVTREEVDINIQTMEKTLSSYREQLSAQEKDVAAVIGESNDPYIRLLQEQIAKLEVQRDVSTSQNPNLMGEQIYNAKIQEIDAQITALRAKLKGRTDQFLRTIVPSQEGYSQQGPAGYLKQIKQKILETQIEAQALHAKRDALSEPILQYESQFERIPAKSMQFARLQRERQSLEKLYQLVEEKYNQVRLVEESEFGLIEIIDPAVAPIEPASPKVLLILLLGVVLGLITATVVIVIREYNTPMIQSPDDLKRLGHSVLSNIGRMDGELKRLGEGPTVVLNKKAIDAHIVTLTNPGSTDAEAYRHLRTTLRYAKGENAYRTILVTSGRLGEGKSTTICNLGVALAGEGKKVLLVDADLRRPALHKYFDLNITPGLSDFLRGKTRDEIPTQRTVVNYLDLVPSGSIPPNPSELLGSTAMKAFVQKVQLDYDLVLFDSSPVLAVTDSCILATLVDEALIVVSAGKTGVAEFERAFALLDEMRGKKPGIVLNNFDPRFAYGFTPGRSGYGYYGYGHTPYGADTKTKRALTGKGRQ